MADVYTSAGEALVVDILDTTVAVPTWWIGIGTGTGGAVKTDTQLSAEVGTRVSATTSQPANSQSQFVSTITANASGWAITEAGLFDTSTGGNIVTRHDFAAVNLTLNDTIQVTIQLTQS